jgi:hypothetical protein
MIVSQLRHLAVLDTPIHSPYLLLNIGCLPATVQGLEGSGILTESGFLYIRILNPNTLKKSGS